MARMTATARINGVTDPRATGQRALGPGRGHPRLRHRLPGRDDRQRRPARRWARSCRPRSSAPSRARPTSPAATWPCWRRCSSWRARWRIATAGGAIFAIGLAGFGTISALCGLAPTMERCRLPPAPGRGRRAAGAGLAGAHHGQLQGEARGRAFGVWASATSALTVLGPLRGRRAGRHALVAHRVPVNVPLVIVALYATLRHVPESRNEEAPAPLDWLGSIVIALAVGGISFGLIRGQEHQLDRRAWRSARWASGWWRPSSFPILMLQAPEPADPAVAVPAPRTSR